MASELRALDSNVAGDFFVDDTCIDCGACRWIAPQSFDAQGGYARVFRQPVGDQQRRVALQALVSCPTGSIGTRDEHRLRAIVGSFPRPLAPRIYHCGFHAASSFGAASYLIVREGGNVLVDSPRFNRGLVERIAQLGSVRWMFLTHRDDVADHARFARALGCERILHARDVHKSTRDVEIQLEGDDPVRLAPDLLIVPTPGHTRGSACLIFDDEALFSGDHVAFSSALGHVYAFSGACWYDWNIQIASMARLSAHAFTRILPGHGAPCHFEPSEMREQMQRCVTWMRARA